jgi:hypothetical protein
LVKIHRNYTVEEIAGSFAVHKNTVRNWMRHGLQAIDSRRPCIIRGQALADFLTASRKATKQSCLPNQFYCVGCRRPVTPAGGMVDYVPISARSGNLSGICPDCHRIIYRRSSFAGLDAFRGFFDVTIRKPADG